jgi:hypothetical protein
MVNLERFRRLGLDTAEAVAILDDLAILAEYKYDHYELYSHGKKFLDSLFGWLRQFEAEDRLDALLFVRHKLVFVSQRELQDLNRFLFFDKIVPAILRIIIQREDLGPFEMGVAYNNFFEKYLRRCLFVGLSDGSKIDYFRRQHQILNQEQVIPYYKTDASEYVTRLREDLRDEQASFEIIFLIDDFTASGYTMINRHRDPSTGKDSFDGALMRFARRHEQILDSASQVFLCHYVATEAAHRHVTDLANRIPEYRGKFQTLSALPLSPSLSIRNNSSDIINQSFSRICEAYYSDAFESINTKKGRGIKWGFGEQALPVVLYSNAPNNSLYPIWLERSGNEAPPSFSALFPRVDRHKAQKA